MANLKPEKAIYPAFDVTIVQGKVVFKDREAFDLHLVPLEMKENLQLIIKRKVKPRSRQIEKYYHAVVVRMVAGAMTIADGQAHEFLKNLFLREEESAMLADGTVSRYERTLSTTELGDKRYYDYVFNEVIPWAALPTEDDGLHLGSGLGLYIPLPNEADWDGRDDWDSTVYAQYTQ